jgi:hypothetical protein
MCYRRVEELRTVVESVQALQPSKIYFHLHSANDEQAQAEVEAVLIYIESYEGVKEVRYAPEPLGIYRSMALALNWVAKHEDVFYVFEDDVPIRFGAEKEITPIMNQLSELRYGVFKFGLEKAKVNFWGWAVTKSTVELLTKFDFQNVDYELARPMLDERSPRTHLAGIQHLYRHNRPMAWDDEYDFIIKYLRIPLLQTENEHTDHIGFTSTRGANGQDVPDNNRAVIFINGEIQL